MRKSLLLCAALTLCAHLSAEILLFTYAYTRPELIKLQYDTFKKFLRDEHRLVVFNDAKQEGMAKQIDDACRALNIQCVRIPQEIHTRPYMPRPDKGPFINYQDDAVRNSNVVQYSLDTIGFKHNDIIGLFDSDIFLTKEFSIREYLAGYHIAGFPRMCNEYHEPAFDPVACKKAHPNHPPVDFLWIGLIFLDMATMPNKTTINFNCGYIDDIFVDAGGFTHYYLNNTPGLRVRYFNRLRFSDIMCMECLNRGRSCTHNLEKLNSFGFSKRMIDCLRGIPISRAPRAIGPDWFNWFFELYLNDFFFHYRGASTCTRVPRELKDRIMYDFFNTAVGA